MNSKKITIVTVNLNNAEGLERTILSVVAQTYKPLEFIVIDGDSIDGSRDLLRNYKDHISAAVSEKDTGIYNAMNKGILKSTGDYLLFLNSGDTLTNPGSLQQLMNGGNNADIIYGNIKMTGKDRSKEVIFPENLSFKFFYINSLPHSCTLIRKQLFSDVGYYNETFKIVSDWLFFTLAICKHNYSYKHVNATISDFELGGISTTNSKMIKQERKEGLNIYFPAFAADYKEMVEIEDALWQAKKQLGYRVHGKIKTLFGGK